MTELKYESLTYAIIGAAMEVHRQLGCGFNEKVYQEALELEFQARGIPYEREKRLLVEYKGNTLKQDFYVDFLCYDMIIVELKALLEIVPENRSQVLNYLHCANLEVGLLLNFGQESLKHERLVKF